MYLDSIPLDISLSPEEIIFQKLNAVSGLNLNYNDFVFSDPESITANPNYPDANSKVVITPKAISKFYNSFTVYYRRMDISGIFNNPYASIPRGTGTKLSDLIPSINLEYNVNFTSRDYQEANLPAIDPLDPDAVVKVNFVTKQESLLFIGSYELELNRVVTRPNARLPETASIYILLDQPYETIYKSKLICKTASGEDHRGFQFLRNADTVSRIHIVDFYQISANELLLFGRFEFTANLTGTSEAYTVETLVLDHTGKIIKADSSYDSGTIADRAYVVDTTSKHLYYIDVNDSRKVKRYTPAGTIDTTWLLQGYTDPAATITLSRDKIYVQSAVVSTMEDTDNDPSTPQVEVKRIYLDRYNKDGSKDTSFSRVAIRATHGKDPWPIATVAPIEGDTDTTDTGLYLAFAFDHALDTRAEGTPIVNDTPIVNGSINASFGYLPIVRIKNNGSLDTDFNPLKPRYSPESIYSYYASLKPVVGSTIITAVGNSVMLLAYRPNPITGHNQYMPVKYSDIAQEKRISGDSYFHSYRFLTNTSMYSTAQNYTVVSGKCRLADPNTGALLAPADTVALYKPTGENAGVIYQVAADRNGTPSIAQVQVMETA